MIGLRPHETDWVEALESAVKSFRNGDLAEWELHLIGRRVEVALATEAGTAETTEIGSVHEGAVPEGETP